MDVFNSCDLDREGEREREGGGRGRKRGGGKRKFILNNKISPCFNRIETY